MENKVIPVNMRAFPITVGSLLLEFIGYEQEMLLEAESPAYKTN